MAYSTAVRSLAALMLTGAAGGACAQADNWPQKPVRLIASQSPGGGIDTVARIVATTHDQERVFRVC